MQGCYSLASYPITLKTTCICTASQPTVQATRLACRNNEQQPHAQCTGNNLPQMQGLKQAARACMADDEVCLLHQLLQGRDKLEPANLQTGMQLELALKNLHVLHLSWLSAQSRLSSTCTASAPDGKYCRQLAGCAPQSHLAAP